MIFNIFGLEEDAEPQHATTDVRYFAGAVAVISIFSCLYVIQDFIRFEHKRKVPAKLMLSRTIVDLNFALLCYLMIILASSQEPGHLWCGWLGALFTFFFLLSEAYFIGICWDIWLTLTNPFRQPASDSYQIHILCIAVALVLTIMSQTILNAFEWRKDVEICYIKNTKDKFNWYNLYLLYIPTLTTVTMGIAVSIWAYHRLKKRILDATWELRWEVIRKQFVIVTAFTICYLVGLSCWGPVVYANLQRKGKGEGANVSWPSYLLLIYVTFQAVIDAVAWRLLDPNFDMCNLGKVIVQWSTMSRKHPLLDYGRTALKEPLLRGIDQLQSISRPQEQQNLSNALRTEVISLMSEGLAQAVRRTARRTKKKLAGSYSHVTNIENDWQGVNLQDSQVSVAMSDLSHMSEQRRKISTVRNTNIVTDLHARTSGDATANNNMTQKENDGNNNNNNNKDDEVDDEELNITNIHESRAREQEPNTGDVLVFGGTHSGIPQTNTPASNAGQSLLKRNSTTRTGGVGNPNEELPHTTPAMNNQFYTNSQSTYNENDTSATSEHKNKNDSYLDVKEENPYTSYYLDNIKAKPESRNRYCIRRFNITVKKKSRTIRSDQLQTEQLQVPLEQDFSVTPTLLPTMERVSLVGARTRKTNEMSSHSKKTIADEYDDVKSPFTDYCPHVFRYLRTEVYGISDREYLQSIEPGCDEKNIYDIVSKFSEGRSGAMFFFTLDNKYIIKTLNPTEAQLLLNILPHYKEHMDMYRDSYLNKFLGLHSLKMYQLEIYFVVLSNVFVPNCEPHEKYDLKGSWIDRHTSHHVELGKLMKDEDLKKALLLEPQQSSDIFRRLRNDSRFLMKQHIMDYSLLLGIYYVGVQPSKITVEHNSEYYPMEMKEDIKNLKDRDVNYNEDGELVDFPKSLKTDRHMPDDASIQKFRRRRAPTYATSMQEVGYQKNAERARVIEGPGIYYLGIIDMLQQWDTQKRIEHYIKIYLRCKSKNGISCVEPSFYRKRFLRKMFGIGIRPRPEDYQHDASDDDK